MYWHTKNEFLGQSFQ